MTGLLERIVRRRRASASSRLGPPSDIGTPYAGGLRAAGEDPAKFSSRVNGSPSADGPDAALEARPWLRGDPAASAVRHDQEDFDDLYVADPEATLEFGALGADPVPAEAERPPGPQPVEADAPVEAEEEAGSDQGRRGWRGRSRRKHRPTESELQSEIGAVAEGETGPERESQVGPEPGFRERGRIRQRARYLRALREVQLRDIGGLVLELHRFGREQPDLVQAKVAEAAQTDSELRALERALGHQHPLRELREGGIGGACGRCGAVHGSSDRYCAACGKPLRHHDPAQSAPERDGSGSP